MVCAFGPNISDETKQPHPRHGVIEVCSKRVLRSFAEKCVPRCDPNSFVYMQGCSDQQ